VQDDQPAKPSLSRKLFSVSVGGGAPATHRLPTLACCPRWLAPLSQSAPSGACSVLPPRLVTLGFTLPCNLGGALPRGSLGLPHQSFVLLGSLGGSLPHSGLGLARNPGEGGLLFPGDLLPILLSLAAGLLLILAAVLLLRLPVIPARFLLIAAGLLLVPAGLLLCLLLIAAGLLFVPARLLLCLPRIAASLLLILAGEQSFILAFRLLIPACLLLIAAGLLVVPALLLLCLPRIGGGPVVHSREPADPAGGPVAVLRAHHGEPPAHPGGGPVALDLGGTVAPDPRNGRHVASVPCNRPHGAADS